MKTRPFIQAGLVLVGLVVPGIAQADLAPVPDLGLRLERGFEITEFAGNDLAPDTWCMTFDSFGRLVVGNGQSIRVLIDEDDDGVADDSITFATVERGVMGMCFVGHTLYASADGWLLRYVDVDGDGVADGPPEKLVPLGFGEHGGHAIRQGPDGWLYVIGGNDTGFTGEKHATLDGSPIHKPEAGALLRISPDNGHCEIIAHGLRNPYSFDFNAAGDIFTYDSDVERDAFLPWNYPTRIYHVGQGQHHGWRLTGYQRSWPRPEYYADTVPMLAHVGRGSPTGVASYRHFEFPSDYQDGLFFADWTFGRIYFLPLESVGASYAVEEAQVFLEPTGTQGFAPTDLAVGPDGSLYIAIGGRKTRGAVYRVDAAQPPLPPRAPFNSADLNDVLLAAQPLEAWSRAVWMPAADRLGADPLLAVLADESTAPGYRVRALEVLTEMFGPIAPPRARFLLQTSSAEVRARLAWSLSRQPGANADALLLALAEDRDDTVRRCALDAIADQIELVDGPALARVLQSSLAHADKYVRLAAARVAGVMADDSWNALAEAVPRQSRAVNTAALAQMWRTPALVVHPEVLPPLTNLLAHARDPATRLDAIRLIILALGDWHLNNPTVEFQTGYELATPPGREFDVPGLRRIARGQIPSGYTPLDTEAARLLAMLEDDEAQTPRLLANFLTENSSASSDFHYLACLSRVKASAPDLAPRIAAALLALDRKLGGQGTRVKQNWNARLLELTQQLVRREPAIGDALLRNPQLTTPAHVFLASAFEGEKKVVLARRFLAVVKGTPAFPWNSEFIALFSLLPSDDVVPLFRRQWASVGLRDELLPRLAENPIPFDRDKFLTGLGSTQPPVVRASLGALLKLPPDPAGTNLVAPLKLLHRTLSEPAEQPLRAQLVSLLAESLKQPFKVEEPLVADPAGLRKAYQPIFDFVGGKYPGLVRAMNADDHDDPVRWNLIWRGVTWANGDAVRGRKVFEERACATCHDSANALGPDLTGVAQRLSPEDLMNAIVFPSRDIAPAYRATTFRLRDGQVITGLVAFESADGWLVKTGAGASVRLNSADVVSRQPGSVSVMPGGLLQGLGASGLTDLYAYLRSLGVR